MITIVLKKGKKYMKKLKIKNQKLIITINFDLSKTHHMKNGNRIKINIRQSNWKFVILFNIIYSTYTY